MPAACRQRRAGRARRHAARDQNGGLNRAIGPRQRRDRLIVAAVGDDGALARVRIAGVDPDRVAGIEMQRELADRYARDPKEIERSRQRQREQERGNGGLSR